MMEFKKLREELYPSDEEKEEVMEDDKNSQETEWENKPMDGINGDKDVDSYYTMNDESRDSRSSSENSDEYVEEETSQPMVLQEKYKIQVKFETKMLGMKVAKGNNKLWVDRINTKKLKKKIQVKDIIRAINGERVGNGLSALQSPVQPMYIEFSRMVLVKLLEDEATEYYTDEEGRDSEDISNNTCINNSDIESFDGEESMELTEMELRKIKEKDKKNKEEKDDDDNNYRSNDGNTSNDDDTNDKSKNAEEEENEEEEHMDTTKSNTRSVLCCAGDFCKQQGGQAIIGMSHKCIGCDGRLHGSPCSNEKTDELNGMTCKQCDVDAMA